ncbi:MAG: prepilin-type N-terminal cleavage/methylation domain-containing protein [Opitutaceae bacterium]|nr:prepilin-type N-terminal cleavage/methylation domain-containing protein [Opitutaceae bacterium]
MRIVSGDCGGFSLIEVVVATAIFAVAIVAVVGLLSPMNQRVSDVVDSEIASRVCATIQSELERNPVDAVAEQTAPDAGTGAARSITLVLSSDGRRGRLWEPGVGGPADNPLDDAAVPGIAERDRFFLVTIGRADATAYASGVSGSLGLRAQVVWPFRIPDGPETAGQTVAAGPGADSSIEVPPNQHQVMNFFFTLRP